MSSRRDFMKAAFGTLAAGVVGVSVIPLDLSKETKPKWKKTTKTVSFKKFMEEWQGEVMVGTFKIEGTDVKEAKLTLQHLQPDEEISMNVVVDYER